MLKKKENEEEVKKPVEGEEGTEEGTENEGTEEGIDEESLKKMISKSAQDQIDSIATDLASKYFSKIKAQRGRAIDAEEEKVEEKAGESTRSFLKALFSGDKKSLEDMQKKTATFNETADDPRGGYLLPTELMAEVLRIAEKQYGLCRREFRYLPFTGPGNERTIPTLASSVTTYWVNEAAAKTSSNTVFGLVTQTLKKLAVQVPLTEELLEDSAVNLTQLIAELIAEAMSKEEDIQFLYGTGAPWTGILNNGSVGSVALGTGLGVSSVSFEKLVDMQDALPSGALVGAKYYMNRQILSYLKKARADAVSASDGKGLFLFPPTSQAIADILGFPIELSDAMPGKTLTGANKPFVIFGNLKMAAILGDKQQMRARLLDQATITDGDGTTVINLAQQDMVALSVTERVGYILAVPTAVVVLKTGPAS